MNALLFLWSQEVAVLVTQNGNTWKCECATESTPLGVTSWLCFEATTRELAIEKAASAKGWTL